MEVDSALQVGYNSSNAGRFWQEETAQEHVLVCRSISLSTTQFTALLSIFSGCGQKFLPCCCSQPAT